MKGTSGQVFRIHVHEGKAFGNSPQALACSVEFVGLTKATPYSVATDTHTWNSSLVWSVDKELARRITSVKLNVLRRDGQRLGWVVLNLRNAKLQHTYRREPHGAAVWVYKPNGAL